MQTLSVNSHTVVAQEGATVPQEGTALGGVALVGAAAPDQRSKATDRRANRRAALKLAPRVLALGRSERKALLMGLIALTLGSSINLLFPYLIRSILNQEFGLSLTAHLLPMTFGLIGLFAVQAVFFYYRHYFFQMAGYRVVTKLRNDLYAAIVKQDIAFFDASRVGDLLSRLSADTQLVQRAVTINVSVGLRYILQVIGGICMMLYISWKLSVLILLLIPLIVGASYFWGKRLGALSKRMQAELAQANIVAEESIGAIRTVRIFAGEAAERIRYEAANAAALRSGELRTRVAALFSSTMVFLLHSGIALSIWYGGEQVLRGTMSIGDLTGFLLYCVIVAVSFGFLVGAWEEFMQAVGASERLFEILDSAPKVSELAEPRVLPVSSSISDSVPAVEFRAVTFAYPSRAESPVLRAISFAIPEGRTIALVGPSGGGKSTIASLISRFYDPQQGTIYYRGVPLTDLALSALRAEMSAVPQQPQVFSVSIRENIAYGRPTAGADEIIEAARAAHILDFAESLPQGLDTLVGDRGVQLSGGERQRIAIARAILKDPRFLILDEATSSLDSENEKLVQRALETLMKGRTTLVIAHRLSTVQHADEVLVLKDGSLVQRGTHQELLQCEGLYKSFVTHQLIA